jgi:type IV secretory pathway VirB2 component (pilin)
MNLTSESNKAMLMVWCLVAAYAVMFIPMDALATAGPSGISSVLCNVVGWFTGNIGKGIATLAIIVIGIGALMGKVSWGMAIIVGLGVGIIFGASGIVDALSPSGGNCP